MRAQIGAGTTDSAFGTAGFEGSLAGRGLAARALDAGWAHRTSGWDVRSAEY